MDALWTPQYYQKVLASGPIGSWMQDEKSGLVAYDLVSGRVVGAANGTYTGVTLGQPGIGDGRTAPLYDGANDFTAVSSAALAAVFNGGEGSLLIWMRVLNAGIWTDGAIRKLALFQVNGTNYLQVQRSAVNNTLEWRYVAGGTTETVTLGGLSTTDWVPIGLAWSASAGANGEVKAYYNGAQAGTTQTTLGVWAGALVSAIIGAGSFAPAQVWSGYLGRVFVWDRALSVDEHADFAVVE